MPDRRFVSQLAHNEPVQQVFLASEKLLRPNKTGNLYLQVDLSDRSGSINARMWNASEDDYKAFENGDFVVVDGATQLFQGNMQLIANRIRRARPVRRSAVLPASARDRRSSFRDAALRDRDAAPAPSRAASRRR